MRSIVFLIAHLGGGGAERVTISLANYMVCQGYGVHLIVFSSKYKEYTTDDQIRQYYLPESRIKISDIIGKVMRLRKLLRQIKPETVFSLGFSYRYLFAGGLMGKYHFILSERNSPQQLYKNKFELSVVKYCLKRAVRVVFQTQDARSFYPECIRRKSVIIPNPLKPDLPEAYHGQRQKKIVAFSRLNEQKNIPLMLRAFREFHKKHSDFVLEIYGRGECEAELKAYANMLQLGDAVRFQGYQVNVHEQILKAMCFVSTSDYEGISNSMLEAMAIGLPCICTNCPVGGAAMFIRDGINGFLTPVGEAQAVTLKLNLLAEHPETVSNMSLKASEIRESLSQDKICKRWMELMERGTI